MLHVVDSVNDTMWYSSLVIPFIAIPLRSMQWSDLYNDGCFFLAAGNL